MQWSILFMGPVGAGKTCAIRTLSDIATVETDVNASDETAQLKEFTTVSMDAGVLHLGAGDKVHLLGAPGQDRFDFMWDILLEQAHAVIIMIDHSRLSRTEDLDHFLSQVGARLVTRRLPLALGVTHVDAMRDTSLETYRERLSRLPPAFAQGPVPVFPVDARQISDVRALVIGVAAMLEMENRFGCHR